MKKMFLILIALILTSCSAFMPDQSVDFTLNRTSVAAKVDEAIDASLDILPEDQPAVEGGPPVASPSPTKMPGTSYKATIEPGAASTGREGEATMQAVKYLKSGMFAGIVCTVSAEEPLDDITYQIILYDKQDRVLKSIGGEISHLNAGETTAIYQPLNLPEEPASYEVILLSGQVTENRAPLVTVQQADFIDATFPKVTGILEPHTDKDIGLTPVTAVVYDASGNIVGAGSSLVDIKAGMKAAYEVHIILTGTPADINLYAQPDESLFWEFE